MTDETQDGADRLALCAALADALTAASGDEWTRDDSGVLHAESFTTLGDPAGFRGARFVRARDGFTVRVTQDLAWNRPGRMVARIDWPKNPVESGSYAERRLRDAPCASWSDPEPETGFAAARPVKAVAGQILRALDLPAYGEAWRQIVEMNAAALAARDTAAEWRRKVGAALTGSPDTAESHPSGVYKAQHDSRYHGPSDCTRPVGLELADPEGRRPGGRASVRLPDDPDAAARIVAAMRAAVLAEATADKGES